MQKTESIILSNGVVRQDKGKRPAFTHIRCLKIRSKKITIIKLWQFLMAKDTDSIIIDHGLLFASNEYFSLRLMKKDIRVNIYDENLSGSVWSMHAITLNGSCKGILIMGGEIYNYWELTQEIRDAFERPSVSSNYLRVAY